MKNSYILIVVLAAALALSSCSRDEARISGRFIGNDERTVYLEQALPASQTVVDSTTTDEHGNFILKARLPDQQPTIYNLICGGDRIPLLLAPGEKAKLHAVGSISRNYTVEGSEGSEKLRQLKEIFYSGSQRLDSMRVFDPVGPAQREELGKKYAREYIKIKQDHIAFIRMNTGSLASLYALYQRMPGDKYLSNGDNDIVYYRMVADSLAKRYPASPYVIALQKEVSKAEQDMELAQSFDDMLAEGGIGYIDLDLPDIYGRKHALSASDGKVILVCFWLAESSGSGILNAELRQLYDQYSGSGFEIYQISVDRDKSVWVNTVQNHRPQWISVMDTKGVTGPAVQNFNVTDLPSLFLIDREGNIVARDLEGDALSRKIAELLK